MARGRKPVNNRYRKQKPKKVNYDLESRRRQKARQQRKRMRKADTAWNDRIASVRYYFPMVSKWILKIAAVCLLAFVYVWFFGQKVSVVGDSMNPVLENGDSVLVNRLAYGIKSPKRGDIIVFRPKGNKKSHYYVKRVIGLPGETISIVENSIFIDGEKLEEDYETTDMDDIGLVSEKMKLGKDEYFVLGDDRENSEDSRHADVGNVKKKYIYGKAWFVASPSKHLGFVK